MKQGKNSGSQPYHALQDTLIASLLVSVIGGCCGEEQHAGAARTLRRDNPATALSGIHSDRVALIEEWMRDGSWRSVAPGLDIGRVYAIRDLRWSTLDHHWTAEVCSIGANGVVQPICSLRAPTSPPTMLCVMESSKVSSNLYAVASLRDSLVTVFSEEGSVVWSRSMSGSVQRLLAVDVDLDGRQELLVGSTSGGCLVLDQVGNVVRALAPRSYVNSIVTWTSDVDRHLYVAVLDFAGIKIYGVTQEYERRLQIPSPATVLQVARRVDESAVLIEAYARPLTLQARSVTGKIMWRSVACDPNANIHISSIVVSTDGEWLAVVHKEGTVRVYSTRDGKQVAEAQANSGVYPAAAWLTSRLDRAPILLILSSRGVLAYSLLDRQVGGMADEPALP